MMRAATYLSAAVVTVAVFAGCSSNGSSPVSPIGAGGAPASASPRATASPSTGPSATPVPSPTPSPSPAPSATAVAPSIYVANASGVTTGSITVYAGNPSGTVAEAPFATITDGTSGFNTISGLAVDANGKIYACNSTGSVEVFPANPQGALNEAPTGTISGSNTGLAGNIEGVTVDASGKIYVANFDGSAGTGAITVYAANPVGTLNEAPLATIGGANTELTTPNSLAVDSSGRIYAPGGDAFVNAGTVTVYAANPSGTLNEAPLATIAGSNTGLDIPRGIALDASGRVYVANADDASITVYPANPNGTLNESPLATIAGSNTGLNQPTSVAVDASGKIYVVNSGAQTVTIYAANPSGTLNEAPLATITGMNRPFAIAVH